MLGGEERDISIHGNPKEKGERTASPPLLSPRSSCVLSSDLLLLCPNDILSCQITAKKERRRYKTTELHTSREDGSVTSIVAVEEEEPSLLMNSIMGGHRRRLRFRNGFGNTFSRE